MTGAALTERVVDQARLLTTLLTTISGSRPLPAGSMRIAELMLQGLDDLHRAVSNPPAAPNPDSVEARRLDYLQLVDRLRNKVVAVVPPGSSIAVVSRGDSRLLELDGRTGWHLPQNPLGVWAGFHPADGAEALEHLRRLHRNGARYVVVPGTSRWWLDFYTELREYLNGRCHLVIDDEDLVLFRLPESAIEARSAAATRYDAHVAQFIEFADVLLPAGAVVLVVTRGDDAWLSSRRIKGCHFPSNAAGVYAGHPADENDAIAALRRAIAGGAGYVALPAPMCWWQDVYPAFLRNLHTHHRCLANDAEVGMFFELTPGGR